MPTSQKLRDFADLIHQERKVVLADWRSEVCKLPSAQHLDQPTLNDHVPTLLEEIASALRAGSEETISEALLQQSPPAHGLQRLKDGFDIEEVVAEYNILRGSIHDLAEDHNIAIQGRAFHILNRVLDNAIGLAVQTYAAERAREVQQRRDEYLAFVVHDLRTPLSAVTLATNVLQHQQSDSSADNQAQLFAILTRNLAQLDGLVARIIEESVQTLSEGQRIERRRFDLWPLVERLGEDLKPKLADSDIQFENSVPPDLDVYADAHLVYRVFQNLVANAIKYTPGGRIEIGANGGKGLDVECWVSDTGVGIPEDLIGKVFEKLETDPGKEEGSGYGLAIVKSFVELHSGSVTVESTAGVGTIFRFNLPAS